MGFLGYIPTPNSPPFYMEVKQLGEKGVEVGFIESLQILVLKQK
jgi:hypothetical protein